jgi:hypothetical protein
LPNLKIGNAAVAAAAAHFSAESALPGLPQETFIFICYSVELSAVNNKISLSTMHANGQFLAK